VFILYCETHCPCPAPDGFRQCNTTDTMRSCLFVALGLLAFFVVIGTCAEMESSSPGTAAERSQPRTPEALYAEVGRAQSAGDYRQALIHARTLVNEFSDSPHADSAAALIPALEAGQDEQVAAEARQQLAAKWSYGASEDPMTSRVTRSASIRSENTVNFGWPYQGAQRARLTLRNHPQYGQDVILRIEQGQILCHSWQDCRITVRFDESAPQTWNAVGPSDNSTESIFIRNYARFLQRMRNAEVVRIQIPVYQEGNVMFEFHVAGYDHQRYTSG
jgi:hypothetical protein